MVKILPLQHATLASVFEYNFMYVAVKLIFETFSRDSCEKEIAFFNS